MPRLRTAALGVLLTGLTLGVYAQVLTFDFVGWDDDRCVFKHPVVSGGLSWDAVAWVFANPVCANWTPLAWLSHMLDFALWGPGAGGHHATSLLLHLINTLLVFGVLRSLTGAVWRSACVAALFAIHPLHVESVAWVAERRDVLSAAFGLGCVWSYARWARTGSGVAFGAACIWLALGLLSKSMLVTLPVLLLLLDHWPLGRLGATRIELRLLARRLLEKLPFFALAAASGVTTLLSQSEGAVMPDLPVTMRVANALVAYCLYLWKTVWPHDLAAFYPHPSLAGGPEPWTAIQAGAAALLLLLLTLLAMRARRHPFVLVGWLWFLIGLLPVIGLVQVGAAAMADRYTYVPLIGIFVAVVWGANAAIVARGWQGPRSARLAAGIAGSVIVVLAVVCARQVAVWRDSASLFAHAVRVTEGNYTMHFNLANEYQRAGDGARARRHYEQALVIYPQMGESHMNLGALLRREGELDAAIEHYRQAAYYLPSDVRPLRALAEAGQARDGSMAVLIDYVREQLAEYPDAAALHATLGTALLADGKIDAAIAAFRRALELDPELPDLRPRLEAALARQRAAVGLPWAP